MHALNTDEIGQFEKEKTAHKIKNELTDYFKFVALLEKDRPSKSARLIEEYIKSESNISQRIYFIEELDREDQVRAAHYDTTDIDQKDIEKAKEIIKPKRPAFKFTKTSFITYFFSSRKLIKQFGERTGIISSSLFSIRMTGDSEYCYKRTLHSANLLLKPTNYILENGWEKLNRKSYNVISTFSKFLRQFIQLGNILNDEDIVTVTKKLDSYLDYYLRVTSKKLYKEILKESFYEILLFTPAFKQQFKEIISFINDITNTESRGLCFFNIMLGILMLRYKRFIVKLPELMDHYNTQDIDDSHYDFSPNVLQHIRDRLYSLENKYQEAQEKLFFMSFLEEDFNFKSSDDNPVIRLFGTVYFFDLLSYPKTFEDLKKEGEIASIDFMKHTFENVSESMLKFSKGLLAIYNDFLLGRVNLQLNGGKKKNQEIFKDWFFSNELVKLKEYHNALENLKGMIAHLTIPFETYSHFNNTGKAQLEKEERLCTLFKNIINTFYSLADKIVIVLYNNFTAQNLKGEKMLSLAQSKDKPLTDLDSEPRLLPFAMHHIVDNPYLENQLVINVLNDVMIFCLNFCLLFNNRPLETQLKVKHQLLFKSEEYLSIKSKIEE